MRTKEQYISSLSDGREVYYRGKKVDDITEHPVLRIAALHASKLFEMKRSFQHQTLGEISRYFVVPRSSSDLISRHRLIYDTTMACSGIFNISQAIGSDAIFALHLVSSETDSRHPKEYFLRVKKYHEMVAKKDLTL